MSDLINHGSGYKTRTATWYWRAWWWIGYHSGLYAISWWRQRRKHPMRYLLVGEPGYGRTYGPDAHHLFGTLGPITLDIETYADIYFGTPKWWEWRKRRTKTRARRKWKAEKFNVLYGGDMIEYEYDGRTLDGLLALRENAENIAMESGDKRPSDSLGVLPEPVERVKNFMVQAEEAQRMERERYLGLAPDPDYSCGAAYCDDPACNTHGPRGQDD